MCQKVKEWIKNWGTLLAVMGSVTTATVWINDRYPTKSDLKYQIDGLKCRLEKNSFLVQYEIAIRNIQNEGKELKIEITELERVENRTPSMDCLLNEKKQKLIDNQQEFKGLQDKIQKLQNELASYACDREVK